MTAKKIIQFSLGPIGAAGLSFITLPLVAWYFPVENVGKLSMLQVSLSFAVMLFSLAMHQAYVREYHEEENKSNLLRSVVLPGFLMLLFFTLIVVASPISISKILFDVDSSFVSLLFVVSIFASFFINFLAHVLRMQERGIAFSITQIMPKAMLVILLGFIIFLNLENSFDNLLLINTIAIVVSVLTFSYITKEIWVPAITVKTDKKLIKKLLKFSLPLVAGSLAYWGLTAMDKFFIRYMSNFEELGVYAMAVSIAGGVSILSTIFSNLWHPTVYKWVKDGVDASVIQKVIESMLLGVVFVWSMIGLFSWVVLYFLPVEYIAIEYLLVACVSIPLFYMLSETTVVGIGITRKSSYALLASIVAFVVNAILNYFLIPLYGASGAAIATIVSFFIFFMVRTESSAYLWVSLPRVKIYIILVCYMVATVIFIQTEAKIKYFYFVWVFLFFLSAILYSNIVSLAIDKIKDYKNKGK